ncbi:phosphate ABC transporter ATP-binding protein [Pelolinea submarina]|uniref:Phosphate ABC transporter ATP-binding protein (PhoT family) n=1 Tax=Pelolinea submarina TaxID=913107 RepID=A0A347ZVN8_9CHLR|nr:phosphate ABC transporter ATP-binding protein [Pelolinea submarina]REG07064.1 phosphate ABC transporter ATP-binding protein (PhoT family) [Pelolinea submarina]BBB49369.1 phosphate transport system ATP-binding protein [Pelolinea submarina]
MTEPKIQIRDLYLRYSDGKEALKGVSLDIQPNLITVAFGPSGGGKSSLVKVLNRLIDLSDVDEMRGEVRMGDLNILGKDTDVVELRRRIGVVFSRPIPLPLTIFENVSFGLEVAGMRDKKKLSERVEQALREAVLWDEIYDRLDDPAASISGGQQQRLCLARVLALKPEVILLDEPTSALDPVSTAKIEEFLETAKKDYTILLVPHNQQQAARMADKAAFFLQGELVEYTDGESMFINPRDKRTQEYVQGRFG